MKVRVFAWALLAAAVFFICSPASAMAAPALYLVQSQVGKVYLFGTVHVLRPDTQWRSPQLEAAMKESQDLYLEVADPTNAGAALTSLVKIGFDREHPLSTKVTKADVALLDAQAKQDGYGSEAAFESMRPWLVSLILSLGPVTRSGYSPASGVDVQVRKEFVAAGKPVYGFETFDQQAHILADIPEPAQVVLLEYQLKNLKPETDAAKLDAIVKAWLSGDEDDLATLVQANDASKTAFGKKMLTDRNQAWANALAERLKQPGTSFISVGAAHLLGSDGVPALLGRMGFTVTRVQIPEDAIAGASPGVSSPTGQVSPAPTTSPVPTVPATPVRATLTPPSGWQARSTSLASGGFTADTMWVDPNRRGVIVSGHIDMPGITPKDLDALDQAIHEGMVAGAGSKGTVQPSTRVKICNGTQDATYSKVSLTTVHEDIVLAVSDRGYLAEYVRAKDVPDNPAAVQSLLTLCTP